MTHSLHMAALCGKDEVTLTLINEFGCDTKVRGALGRSLLHSACGGGSVSLVRTLIHERNADINARDDNKCQHWVVVRTLIREYNADVNARDDNNDTPLHVAALCGKDEVALTLINEFGCDTKVRGALGRSLLHKACEGGSVSLVRISYT